MQSSVLAVDEKLKMKTLHVLLSSETAAVSIFCPASKTFFSCVFFLFVWFTSNVYFHVLNWKVVFGAS